LIVYHFFELARVLVCFDHVASFIENANHGMMRATEKLCVVNCVRGVEIPQATEWQRIGNQINAARARTA
jgi:hypothetical protein